MRNGSRGCACAAFAGAALAALAVALVAPSPAAAQLREFSGKVTEISGDKLGVDNRRGDRVSFRRSEATEVTGAKSSWQAIEAGDWVSVSWEMVDSPRIAYKIVVLPPKRDPAD